MRYMHLMPRGSAAVILAVAFTFIAACTSKLEDEYDFRPYIVAWRIDNCGSNKKYNCVSNVDWAGGGFDGEDYVYGIYYLTPESEKRIVWVKVAAKKPHERTVVGDEPAEKES